MKLEVGKFCPLIKKDCVGMKCSWFSQIRGTNPNTGEAIDEWGCAITWMPMLLIENSQQQRGTSASVQSFRNEMVQQGETLNQVLIHAVNQQAALAAVEPTEIKLLSNPEG
jgi:hypothetical protein